MNNLKYLSMMVLALVLGACGGGGDGSLTGGGVGGGGVGDPTASNLTLIANSTQLSSDNSVPVELTAIVTDSNSGAVEGAGVTFSTSTDVDSQAQLSSSNVATDANGWAKVTLSSVDPTNRAITVTASLAGGASDTVVVNVTGSKVTISGPSALGLGESADYTVFVSNSNNQALPDRIVEVASENGNSLSSNMLETTSQGTVKFTLTADVSSEDTISVISTGASNIKTVMVSSDIISIESPVLPEPPENGPPPRLEVPIGDPIDFTVRWTRDGEAVNGEDVSFAVTRGILGDNDATTVGGVATTTLYSESAGVSTLTAFDAIGGASNSIDIEFVALTAATLNLQSQFTNLVPGQTSTLTARVRDANNNLVKNKTILFSLLADDTGSQISPLQAVTDSNGIAQTFFQAGAVSGDNESVTVRAVVSGTETLPPPEGPVADTADLTVGGQAFSFDIGTGNSIDELSDTLYGKEWSIIVTDANSNPVANTDVQVSGLPTGYRKGFWFVNTLDEWEQSIEASCFKDIDGNFPFPVPNVASVAPIAVDTATDAGCDAAAGSGGLATTVRTNALGIARVCVIYNQDKAFWAQIDLKASANVAGEESSGSQVHWLTGAASDYEDASIEPPGRFSPYGIMDDCANPL